MKKTIKTAIVLFLATGMALPAMAQTKASAHKQAHKNLIAHQSSRTKDKIKLVKESSWINFEDDVEPEIDIYKEGWNSKRVNPFNESQVPDRYVIDVTGYVMPVPGQVTSGYGYRPKFGRMHKGTDLHLKMNDTVVSAFDGVVRVVNYEGKGYGNYVIIRHPNGLETVYGHLNKHLVKENQTVRAGQPIGLGGSTGRSTGPHLHFETRFMGYPINPAGIFDFANHCTHTDTYTFTKKTYTEARNFAPQRKTAQK